MKIAAEIQNVEQAQVVLTVTMPVAEARRMAAAARAGKYHSDANAFGRGVEVLLADLFAQVEKRMEIDKP